MFFDDKDKISRKIKRFAYLGLTSVITALISTRILMAGSGASENLHGEIVQLTGAVVTDVNGNAVRYQVDGQQSEDARAWYTALRRIDEALLILPSQYGLAYAELMGLAFDKELGKDIPVEPRVMADQQLTDGLITYRFPCRLTVKQGAAALVGWYQDGERNQRGCEPPGVTISGEDLLQASIDSANVASLNRSKINLGDLFEELGKIAIETSEFEYCSVLSREGETSGFDYKFRQSLFEPEEIVERCEAAMQECEAVSDSPCFTSNFGRWSVKEILDKDVAVSIACINGSNFSEQSNFSGGMDLLAIEEALKALLREVSSQEQALDNVPCIRSFLVSGELNLSLASEETTLIQARGLPNDSVVIDVITGSVKIRSTSDPEGEIIEAGNTYYSNSEDQELDQLSSADRLETSAIKGLLNFEHSEASSTFQQTIYEAREQLESEDQVLR